MVVRGLPKGLAKDGWWLDDETPKGRSLRVPGFLALVCVGLADLLLWDVSPGLGLAVWFLLMGGAIQIALWPPVGKRQIAGHWAVLCVALVPLVDLVQFISVAIALAGLLVFAIVQALGRWDAPTILRAVLRLPFVGPLQIVVDALAVRVQAPAKGRFGAEVRDWVLPLTIGGIFMALMGAANPIVDRWLTALYHFDAGRLFDPARFIFWTLLALAIWPLLRLSALTPALAKPASLRLPMLRMGLVTPRAILRALVVFNLIFAMQTLTDLGYLWGGVSLPDGMTYADYAHRGAYPLMVAALLAGVFALVAQPHLDRSTLRLLLYIWVAQTILLVGSAILRLDLYVDAYGLTRMRFFAVVWMVVVALGLALILMQTWGRQTTTWFMMRAAGLGVLAIYVASLINVDGLVARNLAPRGATAYAYMCSLGEGAAPATAGICRGPGMKLATPRNWREWGYRNARLRHNVGQMMQEAAP
ncbi:DUF4173 domain-containing protein [Yoonia sp. SS1-5]|uniref:DUF4173 domain-containing protein n=1 Tax=Yoonia rhodophyticola TaxID=3137370 RepID=A0AAN0MCT7_9RHOB